MHGQLRGDWEADCQREHLDARVVRLQPPREHLEHTLAARSVRSGQSEHAARPVTRRSCAGLGSFTSLPPPGRSRKAAGKTDLASPCLSWSQRSTMAPQSSFSEYSDVQSPHLASRLRVGDLSGGSRAGSCAKRRCGQIGLAPGELWVARTHAYEGLEVLLELREHDGMNADLPAVQKCLARAPATAHSAARRPSSRAHRQRRAGRRAGRRGCRPLLVSLDRRYGRSGVPAQQLAVEHLRGVTQLAAPPQSLWSGAAGGRQAVQRRGTRCTRAERAAALRRRRAR